MNANLVSIVHPFLPDLTLKAAEPPENSRRRQDDNASFDLVCKKNGHLVGHLKAWWDGNDFAGFVRFDREGNVVEWKYFKYSPTDGLMMRN